MIKRLKAGKAPGEDGLSTEFYKDFKSWIVPRLSKLFNKILEGEATPDSWNRSIITLIPKPGKDLEKVESYRPISLINQDAKIFTSIMSNRLNSFISYYIKEDQAGFVKNRYMSDLTRRVIDLMDQSEQKKEKVGFLSLDIFKAFDSLQWLTIQEMIKLQ